MGVEVLHPQNCLKDPFFTGKLSPPPMKYSRNPNKPNRRRRSPSRSQENSPSTLPSRAAAAAVKAANKTNNQLVLGHVKILKRGEEIAKPTMDPSSEKMNLGSTRRSVPDREMATSQIRVDDPKKSPTAGFYAGPVTLTSPPPSELPLPAFFTKKSGSILKNVEATSDLIRILRLDIA